MGSEWRRVTIGEILASSGGEIKTGPFGTKLKASEYSEHGVPVISVGEVQLGRLVLHERTPKVSPEITSRMPEYLLKEGDIVFGRKGAVERSARVQSHQNGWFLGSDGIRLRLPQCCDSRFFGYQLLTDAHKRWIIQHAAGTTMASLNEKIIKLIPLVLPPFDQQQAIAHALGTLDEKIELNRQINTTLEAMAQALFKSWFVDFDPVIDNALAAGNPIPEELAARAERRAQAAQQPSSEQPHSLPAHIRQQFPDRFVFTEEMGWVPEGWEAAPISHVSSLNPESWTLKKHPDALTYVDLANAKNGRINETVTYPFAEAPSRARRVLQRDDSIIGTVRPGNRSFAFIHDDGLTGSTGFAVMRPKASHFRSFVYLALTRDEVIETLAHLADGGAYPAVRPDVVSSQSVALADEQIMTTFDAYVYPWLERIGKNESTNNTLSRLRDTLLPKLLSGQLRIPEAEQLLAEVI